MIPIATASCNIRFAVIGSHDRHGIGGSGCGQGISTIQVVSTNRRTIACRGQVSVRKSTGRSTSKCLPRARRRRELPLSRGGADSAGKSVGPDEARAVGLVWRLQLSAVFGRFQVAKSLQLPLIPLDLVRLSSRLFSDLDGLWAAVPDHRVARHVHDWSHSSASRALHPQQRSGIS
jgi:hypothetical protein